MSQTSLSRAQHRAERRSSRSRVTLIMWRAADGVVAGTMTLGDLVLVNAFMIQLYIPLNFLGVIYREIKQALADMERMFGLLEREPRDRGQARARRRSPARRRRGALRARRLQLRAATARSCTT